MYKFFPATLMTWIDLKEFDLIKNTSNSSKGCVLKVDTEYPKELRELQNDFPLAAYKIEIKREMLPEYQIKIDDLYIFPIGNVKNISALLVK